MIHVGDCLKTLRTFPDASVQCCVTSPPYWGLRDYGHDGQIGLELTPEAYVARMVEVFREVRRVLRDDGTLWLNLGDSYSTSPPGKCEDPFKTTTTAEGCRVSRNQINARESCANRPRRTYGNLKPKDLVGIPWRVAFALQADGWWLRQDIIWHKPNPMPESVRDRCTKAHEYVFLLTKSGTYFYDAEAVKEPMAEDSYRLSKRIVSPHKMSGQFGCETKMGFHKYNPSATGRNRRSVWTITTKPYSGAHFAVMPPDLVEPCIKAGTSEEGCCPACGKPWERVVVNHGYSKADQPSARKSAESNPSNQGDAMRCVGGGHWVKETTGWRAACTCGGSPVPCTVLDPFAGSGTTLAVAAELGRSGIGCELNPEYITLAERRIREARQSNALFEGVPA